MPFRALTLAAPAVMIAACANAIDTAPVHLPVDPPPAGVVAAGTFLPYRPGATAITYDRAVVPPGATVRLTITNLPYGTQVRLATTALLPSRAYGAHLHTDSCAATPDAAGPHYQHHHDPSPPSLDPTYANPANEIWLDFTTDPTGAAATDTTHGWHFDPTRPPRSLVIHADQTRSAPGVAGTAGPRVACLTIPEA